MPSAVSAVRGRFGWVVQLEADCPGEQGGQQSVQRGVLPLGFVDQLLVQCDRESDVNALCVPVVVHTP